MINGKNILIGGIILVVIIFGGYLLLNKETPSTVVVKDPPVSVGGVASPILPYDYFCIGGVCRYNEYAPLTSGTSTVCSLQSPVATSTLVHAGIRFDTGTATAMAFDIVKGAATGATASSTSRFTSANHVFAANTVGTVIASSTNSGAVLATFGPNIPLNYILSSGIAGNYANLAPTGRCWAEWISPLE